MVRGNAKDAAHGLELVGSYLYVIAGDVSGVHGPMALSGGGVFARLQLDAGAEITLMVDSSPELSFYVLQGQVETGGMRLATGDLGLLGKWHASKCRGARL